MRSHSHWRLLPTLSMEGRALGGRAKMLCGRGACAPRQWCLVRDVGNLCRNGQEGGCVPSDCLLRDQVPQPSMAPNSFIGGMDNSVQRPQHNACCVQPDIGNFRIAQTQLRSSTVPSNFQSQRKPSRAYQARSKWDEGRHITYSALAWRRDSRRSCTQTGRSQPEKKQRMGT